ncbi:MAG: AraC family transcriptional regulator [Pantoea sp.]|uniref:AraC family transcriptional regulator n=1 Tax=unclassified Pantoea TaxID=2630326 RepID=UPI0003AC6C08|nr:AraC family transcriptional regulator [Pantoea sp. AS-PWVM4]ERK18649.1 Transcriptional regulator, AraC family [Pantoea sp. AS-PWVM4]
MDLLSDVLQLLSAQSYVTTGQTTGPCWSMRYPGFSGMKFMAVRQGKIWFRLEAENHWRALSPGDGVIITRSAPFIMASDPALLPVSSESVPYVRKNGLADYGGEDSLLLAGKMEIDPVSAEQLLNVLPVVIPLHSTSESSSTLNWLMTRLHDESQSNRPGSALAGNHLMHLVMIEGFRSWLFSEEAQLHGWIGALQDARIMRAVTAIHAEPAKSWQLMELAAIAGLSRAGFARRFTETTGTSPLNYVTHWRMQLASKALRLSTEPIKHLAFRLGYAAESTFSTVFRRVYGVSPSAHRAASRDGPLYRLSSFRDKHAASDKQE